MTEASPTAVRYGARDFDTFVDDLLKYLKDNYGDLYNDYSASSLGMMLVDLYAYGMSQLGWYLDRRATESYLETAKKRGTVAMLARQLGYPVEGAASGTTSVQMTPSAAKDFEWEVYTGYQFQGPNGLVFEALEDVDWASGESGAKDVSVRQAETKQITSVGTGLASQVVRLPQSYGENTYLLPDSVQVFVDGLSWPVNDFLEFGATNQCEVHYLGEPPFVRFGDGVAGNKPPAGAEIRVLFAVTAGQQGNVASASITSTVRPLIQRSEVIDITVTNSSPATGGADPESIESIKANAPQYYASRGVAVTADDYIALARAYSDAQYGRVMSANAFVARTYDKDALSAEKISDVQEEIDDYQTDVGTQVTAIETQVDSIQADIANIETALTELDSNMDSAESASSQLNTALFTMRGLDTSLETVDENLEETLTGDTWAYNIDTLIEALESALPAAATDLEDNWKPALEAAQDKLQAAKSSLSTQVGNGDTAVETLDAALENLRDIETTLGTEKASIDAAAALIDTAQQSIAAEITAHDTAITAAMTALQDHISSYLSADCKANLITVPILVTDQDGYYAAPSNGLIAALQTYLQGRADVAHAVRVVSGAASLVAAGIEIELKVSSGKVWAEVASKVASTVGELLRMRAFGLDLYLSEIYKEIQAITGVDVFNVEITGDEDYLDDDGNLVVSDRYTITKGTITMSELVV